MSRITVYAAGRQSIFCSAEGISLLDALRQNGYALSAPCGGQGRCGHCTVQLTQNGHTQTVLACKTIVCGDCAVSLEGGQGGAIAQASALAAPVAVTRSGYGAAVDLGTTTIAVQLYDLATGQLLATTAAWNAQAAYGADVITRAQYTMQQPDGLLRLKAVLHNQILQLITDLCGQAGIAPAQVTTGVLAGNTVLQHLFAGLPPASIAAAPYTPLTRFADVSPLPLDGLPTLQFTLCPCVSGFVGGDIVAGLLAAQPLLQGTVLFLDIGTNGEMVLFDHGQFLCCSAACGPAFEGAEISCGMQGSPGAICRAALQNRQLTVQTVENAPAKGICGSGLIDLLAALLEAGLVDGTGRLLPPEEAPAGYETYLGEDADENGIFYLTADHAVSLTAADVRKLQLAKAAVAAGIQLLLEAAHKTAAQLDAILLAGGFGQQLSPAAARRIGLLPAGAAPITPLGNTALAGAAQLLLQPGRIAQATALAARCRHIELAGNPKFNQCYMEQMLFEAEEDE